MEYKILEKMFEGEEPSSIFEFGCANAGLIADVVKHFESVEKVGGFDLDLSDLNKAKELFPTGDFFIHNINEELKTNLLNITPIDIVFTVGTLCYQLNPRQAIKNMMALGKKIIVAEFHDENEENPRTGQDGHGRSYFYHDYMAIFKELGITPELTHIFNGKTIIKGTYAK